MIKQILITTAVLLMAWLGAAAGQRLAGGDISMLTRYEQHGAVYLDENGSRVSDLLTYFKGKGLNAMRVRLFVDPSQADAEDQGEGVCQDLDYVKTLGRRIKQAGFDLLLDIHYSDTWTDPGQHSTPASWTVTSALADSVYSYTRRVLQAMVAAGACPDAVQVGNEVTYGMMWPTGHCYPSGANYQGGTWTAFASYLKQGVKACREVCPQARVVIHTEMGRVSNVTSFYQTLTSYGIDYDIIGLSYYPYWHGGLTTLDGLLTGLEATYPGKEIQIVETGYPHAYYPTGASYDLTGTWPATEAGQKAFTTALVQTLLAHKGVTGLYWWFPEANEYGGGQGQVTTDWYNCGWWDNQTGQVMDALMEMQAFTASGGEDEPADSVAFCIVGGPGTWSLTEPLGWMTNRGDGTYVDTLTVGEPIYLVLAEGGPDDWNNDWTAFNDSYRYGPASTFTVNPGNTYPIAKRNNNASYYLVGDGSDYLVEFDHDNLTISFTVIETAQPAEVGDIDGDGQVGVSDVTVLIDYILGSDPAEFVAANADIDGDGEIGIGDVTDLIDLILNR